MSVPMFQIGTSPPISSRGTCGRVEVLPLTRSRFGCREWLARRPTGASWPCPTDACTEMFDAPEGARAAPVLCSVMSQELSALDGPRPGSARDSPRPRPQR